MIKNLPRVLLVLVMFTAFVGQAIAFHTSIPCETSVDSFSSKHHHDEKHHNEDDAENDKIDDCCGIDCCDVGCSCVTNACSSFVFFTSEFDSIYQVSLGDTIYLQYSHQPKSIATLLYRPPIYFS